jgi:hypothetical protein
MDIIWKFENNELKLYFSNTSAFVEESCIVTDVALGVSLKVDPITEKGQVLVIPKEVCGVYVDLPEENLYPINLTFEYDHEVDAIYIYLVEKQLFHQIDRKTLGTDEHINFIFDGTYQNKILGIEILFVSDIFDLGS